MRVFGRHLTDGDGVSDSVSWVSGSTSNSYDPKPDPRDMIGWDEVEDMVEVATNLRDAALVSVAWDAGCCSGEFRDICLDDIQDHDNGVKVTVEGKQGCRSFLWIPSVPYLNQWISSHPGGDSEDPLWCRLNEPVGLSHKSFHDILNRLAGRVGVDKPMTLTNFRKSRRLVIWHLWV